MNDEPSLSEGEHRMPKPGQVWITRRRWNAYFLAASPVALTGALVFWFSSKTSIIAGLVPFAVLWAIVRWSWPREGAAVWNLSATPSMVLLVWWILTWGLLISLGGGFFHDVLVPLPEKGQSWNMPSAMIWVGFTFCWFAGLLIGVSRIERNSWKLPASDDRLLV
jgi:hypothetical protein